MPKAHLGRFPYPTIGPYAPRFGRQWAPNPPARDLGRLEKKAQLNVRVLPHAFLLENCPCYLPALGGFGETLATARAGPEREHYVILGGFIWEEHQNVLKLKVRVLRCCGDKGPKITEAHGNANVRSPDATLAEIRPSGPVSEQPLHPGSIERM